MVDRAIESLPSSLYSGESLSERAYAYIRRDIIRGVRAPGERLRIEKLKTIYGIGPTPIREALQRLSAEQLVQMSEHRGFAVAPLDLKDFSDLNFARVEIEKVALRRSMALGDNAWEGGVVAASYVMAKAEKQLESGETGSIDEWERANAAFHTAMVAACDSRWLLMTRGRLQDMCERYRRASMYTDSGHRVTTHEHQAIAEAVLSRDSELACALTEKHFSTTLEILTSNDKIHDVSVSVPTRKAHQKAKRTTID
jgi:GntR family carbon starvation induced transcriptional regulator